jgi:hypothetical protein
MTSRSYHQWENVFAGQNPLFQASGSFTNLTRRAVYFTSSYTTSAVMVVDFAEKGAKYPATWRDANSNLLEGGQQGLPAIERFTRGSQRSPPDEQHLEEDHP